MLPLQAETRRRTGKDEDESEWKYKGTHIRGSDSSKSSFISVILITKSFWYWPRIVNKIAKAIEHTEREWGINQGYPRHSIYPL